MQEGPHFSRTPSEELPIKKFTLIEINHLLTMMESRLIFPFQFLYILKDEVNSHSLNDFLCVVRPYLGAVNDSELDGLFIAMGDFEKGKKSDEINETLFHILKIALKQAELFNKADARLIGILQLLLNDFKTLLETSPALTLQRNLDGTYESRVQKSYLDFMGHLKQFGYLQEMRAIHLFFSNMQKICKSKRQVLSEDAISEVSDSISSCFLKAFLMENRLISYNEKRENLYAKEIVSCILRIELLSLEYVNAGYPALDPKREEMLKAIIKPFKDFIPTTLLEKAQTPLQVRSEGTITTKISSKSKMSVSRHLITQNSFPPPHESTLLYNPRSVSSSQPLRTEAAKKNPKNTP